VIVENELSPERLAAEILQFADEPQQLAGMGKRARALARPRATAAIVDLLEEVARQ
jgi:UDP-N-acetylglucosamine:LPS N-acetylglucosamine transferase